MQKLTRNFNEIDPYTPDCGRVGVRAGYPHELFNNFLQVDLGLR